MGLVAFVALNATRGGKKPLSVANTSNFADAFGVEVPIPVWDSAAKEINNKNIVFFMLSDPNLMMGTISICIDKIIYFPTIGLPPNSPVIG